MHVRVVVQARQRLFREGLALAFAAEPDIEVVGTAINGAELSQLCDEERPDVVLLEADATDWNPCRLVASLRKRNRAVRIVGIYGAIDRAQAMRAYQVGVRTLIPTATGMAQVAAAVRSTLPRADVISLPTVLSDPAEVTGSLTDRELDVLQLVGAGC